MRIDVIALLTAVEMMMFLLGVWLGVRVERGRRDEELNRVYSDAMRIYDVSIKQTLEARELYNKAIGIYEERKNTNGKGHESAGRNGDNTGADSEDMHGVYTDGMLG